MRAINLREGDEVIGLSVMTEGMLVLTVSETGNGRFSEISDYRVQSRAGTGIINYRTAKFGKVAAVRVMNPDDDIIMVSSDGIFIRIHATDIRLCARPSKGVRVMKLTGDAKLVTLSDVPHDEEEVTETVVTDPADIVEDEAADDAEAESEDIAEDSEQ